LIDARLAKQARLVRWPAGQPVVRGFTLSNGPRAFNPTAKAARFRPVFDAGVVVPTAYGGRTVDIALAESVLRRAAGTGDRVLHVTELRGMGLVTVCFPFDLILVQLDGLGLRKLKLARRDVIDSVPETYPATAALAQQLYDAHPDAHGIVWTSQQCDDGEACMLWGTRLPPESAEILDGPLVLSGAFGVRLVAGVAEACGVLLEL
jgi:hypothetical protein